MCSCSFMFWLNGHINFIITRENRVSIDMEMFACTCKRLWASSNLIYHCHIITRVREIMTAENALSHKIVSWEKYERSYALLKNKSNKNEFDTLKLSGVCCLWKCVAQQLVGIKTASWMFLWSSLSEYFILSTNKSDEHFQGKIWSVWLDILCALCAIWISLASFLNHT